VADVRFPESLDQSLGLLSDSEAPAILAGGTDLFVRMRHGGEAPSTLICLDRVAGMQTIEEGDGEILIRGGAPLSRIMDHPGILAHAPVLSRAISVLGSPQIRNMGTIGGNIMTASPAGDALPALYVLDAFVDLAGPEGLRRLALADFITGPAQTAAAPGEILWQVGFAKPDPKAGHWFEKVGQRTALSISMVSLAAVFSLDKTGLFSQVRLAWGSVGPTVVQIPEIENFLLGKAPESGILAEAGKLARAAVKPISDVRATADYRREVAGRLLLRLEAAAAGEA